MVAARSAAMGFNRLVDARFDALNPRTAMREIPRGAMSRVEATVFVVVATAAARLRSVAAALSAQREALEHDLRAAVEDLQRIPAPDGIQESYKTKIGGIDQWLNVRGQDRGNPIILFVHGGPAAPI